MRIISGSYRGKQIHPPSNFKARPTTDFAKEGLFNILNNNFDFEETDVLDLFAGTGSLTYEFASRGTRRITSIENNSLHFRFIRKNIEEMGFDDVHTINTDVFKFIKRPFESYDLIFADPPFDHPELKTLPERSSKQISLQRMGGLSWNIHQRSPSTTFLTFFSIRIMGM